jgi:hypothetical protein
MQGVPGGQTTDDKPQLHGYGGETFDRKTGRWLPVDSSQVSPDGASYAYFDVLPSRPQLVVVDVASGTTHVALVGDPALIWSVVGYGPHGIYVTHGNGPAGGDSDPNRLWLVTSSGTLTPISDRRSVGGWRIADGFAWAVETDDPSKLNQPGNEERLLRVDLANGTATVWLRRTGTLVEALGTEPDGRALTLVSEPLALWLVAAAGTEQQVAAMGAYANTASDLHGIWLSNNEGIWLITPQAKPISLSSMQALPAGDCA